MFAHTHYLHTLTELRFTNQLDVDVSGLWKEIGLLGKKNAEIEGKWPNLSVQTPKCLPMRYSVCPQDLFIYLFIYYTYSFYFAINIRPGKF